MQKAFIYHHLGLGDQITCAGIIHEYTNWYNVVDVACKNRYYSTIKNLYNNSKIKVLPFEDDLNVVDYIHYNRSKYNCILQISCFNGPSNLNFEERFYHLADVPFEKKWSNFDVIRDKTKEDELFLKFSNIFNQPYKFIHHDPHRNMHIKPEYLTGNVFNVGSLMNGTHLTDNIIDYATIIEKADEIHVLDSCFMFLIDQLKYTNDSQKLYVHRYAKHLDWWTKPILKKNWTILE